MKCFGAIGGLFLLSTVAVVPAALASGEGWTTRTVVVAPPVRPAIGGWATSIVRLPAPTRSVAALSPVPAALTPASGSHALEGIASFYWQFERTANGETYDPKSLTAAHRTLPFNTRVRVTNLANGKEAVVRINNRGPYKAGRVIDLSEAAADAIEMRSRGLVPVKLEVLPP